MNRESIGMGSPFSAKITCSTHISGQTLSTSRFFICVYDEWALRLFQGTAKPRRKTTGEVVGWIGRLNIPVAISYPLYLRRLATVMPPNLREEVKEWLNNRVDLHLFEKHMEFKGDRGILLIVNGWFVENRLLKKSVAGEIATNRVIKICENIITAGRKQYKLRRKIGIRDLPSLFKWAYKHRIFIFTRTHYKTEPAYIAERKSLTLRPYQEEAVKVFLENGRALVEFPPGAGKTFTGLGVVSRKKCKTLILAPTRTIVKQWQTLLDEYFYYDRDDILVMTYQGAIAKIKKNRNILKGRLIIADEAHVIGAPTFRLFSTHGNPILGLTATPERLNDAEYVYALGPVVHGNMTWKQWAENYKMIAIPEVYVLRRGIKTLQTILGLHKNCLVMCATIRECERLASRLNGVAIHSKLPQNQIESIIARFKAGKIKYLFSTVLLSQGFDFPELEAVVLYSIGGVITPLQIIGRVMRKTGSKKFAYIMYGEGISRKRIDEILDILGVYPRFSLPNKQ